VPFVANPSTLFFLAALGLVILAPMMFSCASISEVYLDLAGFRYLVALFFYVFPDLSVEVYNLFLPLAVTPLAFGVVYFVACSFDISGISPNSTSYGIF
jgi:hypothetical protein